MGRPSSRSRAWGRFASQQALPPEQREWLETNGIGGIAGSTIAGVNTRRYHGLLTAANGPLDLPGYLALGPRQAEVGGDGGRVTLELPARSTTATAAPLAAPSPLMRP